MRTLILSDIHDNIEYVKVLRKVENDVYDAIIVAGDIGNNIADEFYAILDSFGCPVFCVYGNWDHDLIYKRKLSNHCVLLHHNIEEHNGYFFTGFSGCPTSWGNNPFYLEYKNELHRRHSEILSQIDHSRIVEKEKTHQIDLEYQEKFEILANKTKDRRLKSYKAKICRLEERKAFEIRQIEKEWRKLYNSKAYKKYEEDRGTLGKKVLSANREVLFNKIRELGIPDNKLIIVTHERMYKIAEEGIRPLIHIFGHVHKYKFTEFKGTYYLNAAAIDNGLSEFFGREELLPEGYCDVTFIEGNVNVTRKLLLDKKL